MEVMIVGAQSSISAFVAVLISWRPVRPDLQLAHAFSPGLLRLLCASCTLRAHSVASAVALVGSAARTRHRTHDGALARQGTRVDRASVASRLSHWLARTRSYPSRAWLRPLHLVGTPLRICLSVLCCLSMPKHALPLASVALPLSDAESGRER
jgi:hypothetical protein